MSNVGNIIKEERLRKGYTQDQLADELHVTRQAVSSWETGRSEPDIKTLKLLSDMLELDAAVLLGELNADSCRQMREKYKKIALISGMIFAVGFIANIWIEPSLKTLMQHEYKAVPYWLYSFGAVTLYLISLGICIGSIISIYKDLSVKGSRRWLFVLAGIALVIPVFVTAFQFFFHGVVLGSSVIPLVFPFIITNNMNAAIKFLTTGAPVMTGLFLFIGMNVRRE